MCSASKHNRQFPQYLSKNEVLSGYESLKHKKHKSFNEKTVNAYEIGWVICSYTWWIIAMQICSDDEVYFLEMIQLFTHSVEVMGTNFH